MKAPDAEALFDLEKLRKISRGNDSFIRKILHSFNAQAEDDFDFLVLQTERRENLEIQKAAHKIKGSFRNIGYTEGLEHFGYIEDLLHEGQELNDYTAWLAKAEKLLSTATTAAASWIVQHDQASD